MSIHARRPKVAAQHLRLLSADTTGRLVSNEEPAVTRMRRRFAPGTLAGATPVEQQQPDQRTAAARSNAAEPFAHFVAGASCSHWNPGPYRDAPQSGPSSHFLFWRYQHPLVSA
jgi:hypothetical protein